MPKRIPPVQAVPEVDWRKRLGKPETSSHATLATRTLGPDQHTVEVTMTPGLAAEVGKQLIDWAFTADPLAAVAGVGEAMAVRR